MSTYKLADKKEPFIERLSQLLSKELSFHLEEIKQKILILY
jgi:hypothetical protein